MERLYLMLQILKMLSKDTAIHFKSTLNSQGARGGGGGLPVSLTGGLVNINWKGRGCARCREIATVTGNKQRQR